jgi:hypothetical protein
MVDLAGDWKAIRPDASQLKNWVAFDHLVPDADWFWVSLQRDCVPECCGLAAYDFSAVSVSWACGWGTLPPEANDWRDDSPGDPVDLARRLRLAAQALRTMKVPAVAADLFNDILTPESYADLFEDLAAKAEPNR